MEVNSTCYPKFDESIRASVKHYSLVSLWYILWYILDGIIGNKGYIRTKLILRKGDSILVARLISIMIVLSQLKKWKKHVLLSLHHR